jgi:hypothetical protein
MGPEVECKVLTLQSIPARDEEEYVTEQLGRIGMGLRMCCLSGDESWSGLCFLYSTRRVMASCTDEKYNHSNTQFCIHSGGCLSDPGQRGAESTTDADIPEPAHIR